MEITWHWTCWWDTLWSPLFVRFHTELATLSLDESFRAKIDAIPTTEGRREATHKNDLVTLASFATVVETKSKRVYYYNSSRGWRLRRRDPSWKHLAGFKFYQSTLAEDFSCYLLIWSISHIPPGELTSLGVVTIKTKGWVCFFRPQRL